MENKIDYIYRLVKQISNKEQSGHLSPDAFNRYLNAAQMDLFTASLPGKFFENGRRKYEQNQRITDELSPFKVPVDLIIDTEGKADYPGDYEYFSSLGKKVVKKNNSCSDKLEYQRPIRVLDDDKVNYVLGSRVTGPTAEKPVATMYSTHIQFWPYTILTARLTYLVKPQDAEWKYTEVNRRFVYDPTTSIDVKWRATALNELAYRILKMMGINLREDQLAGYAGQLKSETEM